MQRDPPFGRRCLRSAIVCIAGALLVTLGLGALSAKGNLWVAWRDMSAGAYRGNLNFTWNHDRPATQILSPGAHVRWSTLGWNWSLPMYASGPPFSVVRVPVWLCCSLLVVALGVAIMRFKRASSGAHCSRCGYDLCGLPKSSSCPECGQSPRTHSSTT